MKLLNYIDTKSSGTPKNVSPLYTLSLSFKVEALWGDEDKSVGHCCWTGWLSWGLKRVWWWLFWEGVSVSIPSCTQRLRVTWQVFYWGG